MISDFNSDVIEKVFENVHEAIACSEIVAYSQILAGIFALCYIGNIFWKSWGKGQELHIIDFAKPFVIFFCITNFSLVTGLLDHLIGEPLNKGTLALVENNNNVMDAVAKYQAKVAAISEKNKEDQSWIEKADNAFKAIGDWIDKSLYFAFMGVFNMLGQLVCVIAKTCMIAYSFLLRIILTIFGPIAFALSLIPYYSDNIKNWISRYIGALLYVPICNIILYVTQCFATALFNLYALDLSHQDADNNAVVTSGVVVAIMFIVSACAYFTVPKLAGMIVSMGDYGSEIGFGQKVMGAASSAGAMAAGVMTGGASMAALGNGSFMQSIGAIINAMKNKGGTGGDSGAGENSNAGKENSGVRGDG